MGRTVLTVVMATVVSCGAGLGAEEPAAPSKPSGLAPVRLKVEVTFSRYQGESRVSRSPFVLAVTTGDPAAKVVAGLQYPVHVRVQDGTTVMFKDAATKVECSAEAVDGGRFRLTLEVEQTTGATGQAQAQPAAAPVLHTFRSQSRLLLRDGESAQFVAASDPVSGDRLEVDVALQVRK
jgi:hypothetical protein